MGYTPNELKAQIVEHEEAGNELNSNLAEAVSKERLVRFFDLLQDVKDEYTANKITAIQAQYKIEVIKSKPL